MDTLKDFWKDIKDRVSSPFFSSFVIAWMIFNYEIVVALLFYKQAELKADGYTSYLNMIQSCRDYDKMFFFPLFIAIFYSVIFKELIRIIQTHVFTWSSTFILWSTKSSSISAEVHRHSEKTLKKIIAEYSESIDKEGVAKIENENLKEKINVLTATFDIEMKELNRKHDERYNQLVDDSEKRIFEAQTATFDKISNHNRKVTEKQLEDLYIREGELNRELLDVNKLESLAYANAHEKEKLFLDKMYLEDRLKDSELQIQDINKALRDLENYRNGTL